MSVREPVQPDVRTTARWRQRAQVLIATAISSLIGRLYLRC